MKMESIDLVDEERQDVQDEATQKQHGVQEYMKKEKRDSAARGGRREVQNHKHVDESYDSPTNAERHSE